MHVKAGTLLADIHGEPAATGRQHENGVDLLHRLLNCEAACERPEVIRVRVVGVQRVGYPRVGSFAYLDVVVALVVLEQYVIFRLVELYKAAFQHQCVKLARADDKVEIRDIVDKLQGLGVVVGIVPEVGGHAVFERLRLSDVDYLPGLIFHEIHAGAEGQAVRLVAQIVDIRIQH